MRNLDIHMDAEMLHHCSVYRVSRSSSAYSFFTCEYRNLPVEEDGSIIAPPSPRKETETNRRAILFLQRIRDSLTRDHSVRVPISSKEYPFFRSEYSHQFSQDLHENIIVPEDEYPKKAAR